MFQCLVILSRKKILLRRPRVAQCSISKVWVCIDDAAFIDVNEAEVFQGLDSSRMNRMHMALIAITDPSCQLAIINVFVDWAPICVTRRRYGARFAL